MDQAADGISQGGGAGDQCQWDQQSFGAEIYRGCQRCRWRAAAAVAGDADCQAGTRADQVGIAAADDGGFVWESVEPGGWVSICVSVDRRRWIDLGADGQV